MEKKIDVSKKISKVKKIMDKVRELLNDIYLGEKTYNKITGKLVNASRVFIVSTRKFMADGCPTKASSIAYTSIISLIPTLTVVLTIYSVFSGVGDKKEEIFSNITRLMIEHNIKLDLAPILDTIASLIENAGKIGGIGAIIMIFSATALLRTMEQSLNDIFNIEKARSILLKIIYYWAALSLGPIIVISGTTLATQFTSIFSSPDFKSAYISDDSKVWVVGGMGEIMYTDTSKIALTQLPLYTIDFDNQKFFQYDLQQKKFIEEDFKIEESEFKNFRFNDIQFIKNRGWIVGKDGIVLITKDEGKTWQLYKFGSFYFNDVRMVDSLNGFIACENGYLLSTNDGGNSWSVTQWNDIRTDMNSMAFYRDHGIICGDNGIILTTEDRGKTWDVQNIDEARRKKRYVNLNNSYFINDEKVVLIGDEGTILISNDGGKTWKKKKFLERNYHAIYFADSERGYIAGEKGEFITTIDGGETWQRSKISRHTINKILPQQGSLWAIGDMGFVKKSGDNGKTWNGIQGGNFVLYLLNFLTPFLSIWLLFLLIYIVLPNMKIPFKPAAIGAAFTSIVWVIFILSFGVYVKSFAKGTLAIYGALASIPIFLLMVYASSIIVLYGAEVSYTLMHPHTYRNIKKAKKEKKEVNLFYGISILHHIYDKFEKGKGSTSFNELLKITSNKSEDVDHFIDIFKKEKLVIETDEGDLIPANSSKNIVLSDLIGMIHDVSLTVPGVGASPDKLKKFMDDLFSKMRASKDDIMNGITLGEVIAKAG